MFLYFWVFCICTCFLYVFICFASFVFAPVFYMFLYVCVFFVSAPARRRLPCRSLWSGFCSSGQTCCHAWINYFILIFNYRLSIADHHSWFEDHWSKTHFEVEKWIINNDCSQEYFCIFGVGDYVQQVLGEDVEGVLNS